MRKLLMTIGAAADLTAKALAAAVAVGALLPHDVLAASSTPPSTLVDLTTSSWGSVTNYSECYSRTYTGAKAFDDDHSSSDSGDYSNSRWLAKKADNMYVTYKFNAATVVDAIQIFIPENGGADYSNRAPKVWTFKGSNDNSSWDTLDTQDSETGWAQGDSRYYKFANTKAYQYYKFNCTAVNGGSYLQVQELEFYCIGTGDSTWTGGGETGLVNDDANWGGAAMPGSECEAHIDNTGDTPATIPAGPTVWKRLRVGAGSGKNAKVVQEMGTVAVAGDFDVGYDDGACGEYKMSGGRCTTGTSVFVGYDAGSQGLFEMTGGTLSATSKLGIGRFGHGTFSASGDGTVVTAADVRVGFTYNKDTNKGYGTFIVTNGAEVATTKIYAGAGAEISRVDRAKVVFDGAKLTATAANATFMKDLLNIQLGDGGLTIDTQGYNLGINNCTFNVTGNGKITVVDGGTVTFTDVTLNLPAKPSGTYVFAETDGTFSGLPNLGGVKGCKISLSDDCKRVMVSPRGFIISIF